MNYVNADENIVLELGRQREEGVTRIRFPLNAEWLHNIPEGGQFQAIVCRPGEEYYYPVIVTVDNEYVNWEISRADLDIPGYGLIQLAYLVDGKEKRSKRWTTSILPSSTSGEIAPDPAADWVDDVIRAGAEARASAESAQTSAVNASASASQAYNYARESEEFRDEAAGIMGLAVFEINAEDGNLYVTYPTPYYGATFSINQNGYLEVTI